MTDYVMRYTACVVAPQDEPMFSEKATTVSIADESAGEFVQITQQGGSTELRGIAVNDMEEWKAIASAVEIMLKACKSYD